jgi:hypothetical protein
MICGPSGAEKKCRDHQKEFMIILKTRMTEFPSNAHMTLGYLTQPDDRERHPAIVVIQEWWDWCRTSKT